MTPGFGAEAALPPSGHHHWGVVRTNTRQVGEDVTPASILLKCFIGEYVNCLRGGGVSPRLCQYDAEFTCRARALGADM